MKRFKIVFAAAGLLLCMSVGFIVYTAFFGGYELFFDSYQQSVEQINIVESGIILNNLEFAQGEDIALTYDLDNAEYPELLEKYNISEIAGEGSEFEKAKRLMNEFSPRLTHESYYDNHIDMNALALLEYSLDNKKQGINCRSKAQILNEMCLALGIYSRKVWIMPYSEYDGDCHVVNEVYDVSLNKWVMLDISNNFFWVDENGTPLSVLEIRERMARQKFCTPAAPGDSLDRLEGLQKKYYYNYLYIEKNMVWMRYCEENTVCESDRKPALMPANYIDENELLISVESAAASPVMR